MADDGWERVLWKKQSFPDNYLPPSFLSSLKLNANFEPYSYWPLVLSACAITQHLSVLFVFLSTFVRIHQRVWDPRVLICVSVIVFLLGYTSWELLEYQPGLVESDKTERRAKTVKSSILVFLSLMSLSPVFRTLTAATSSDSIWALTACLFMLNILLGDYGPPPVRPTQKSLTSVLSMNAAISASVVLASRLRNDTSVFALMLFSIQLFALFPILRIKIMLTTCAVRVGLTMLLIVVAMRLGKDVSGLATAVYTVAVIMVTFVAPGVLFWAQRHKNEIKGPWDVAIPHTR